MFLPATREELAARGWEQCEVILVSGDAYTDTPFDGVAVIGKVLTAAGYRVGVVAQPGLLGPEDITRLGLPKLFWGISAGCVDSLVANRTALGKPRREDDFTPGGRNDRRPDRASIVYANLIRRHAGSRRPIVLGGIEASLRRLAHYDFWEDRVRRSLLLDAKADALVYGQGERAVLALAERLASGRSFHDLPGLCVVRKEPPAGALELPSFEAIAKDTSAFELAHHLFAANAEGPAARQLCQGHGDRWVVHNPPAAPLAREELDAVHELGFEREAHPSQVGKVRALDTVRFSLLSHRGCYGGCSFCAIAVHQGRTVISRSRESLLREAAALTEHPRFRGIITDVGGPTANMYGFDCPAKQASGPCAERQCLGAAPCPALPIDHAPLRSLLRALTKVPGVRQVFVASGVRHDLVLADERQGPAYLADLVRNHVGGQLKLAPEHCSPAVLGLMNKPPWERLVEFRRRYQDEVRRQGVEKHLSYYLIAAHPGCTLYHMTALAEAAQRDLHLRPEQVQIFTPTPGTLATVMYHTGRDPRGNVLFVERSVSGRAAQRAVLSPSNVGEFVPRSARLIVPQDRRHRTPRKRSAKRNGRRRANLGLVFSRLVR
ncbi:MAG: YgiQ family radical SAM protein [Deltaproteobacteria bacterium RIFOXYA12_FULL_61_11]|nr:MAG: YgiQ family radical SAM protein [Deltaproteobacteria bacterium RIFOXYA12_FULL_61_11]